MVFKGWTVKALREALAGLDENKAVLLDGCSCCADLEKGGVTVRDTYVVLRKTTAERDTNFDDEEGN